MIGKIERVPLKSVFPHEAYDFTVWLAENPDVISEAIGLNLTNVEREQVAEGSKFITDLTAETEDGSRVVIENQFGRSDHRHLGQLVTYVATFEAKIAIWIVENPRPEHGEAINWLNEAGAAAFYLLKAEAIKIGASEHAPLLTLITGPSEEVQQVGKSKKEFAQRHHEREQFWATLLQRSKGKTKLFSNVSPSRSTWIATGGGKSGITFQYYVWQEQSAINVYIERPNAEDNTQIFGQLLAEQASIEDSFGKALDWDQMEGRLACRIRFRYALGGYRTPEKWPEICDAMIDGMVRLVEATRPQLAKLKISG